MMHQNVGRQSHELQVASVSVVYMDDEGQPVKTGGVIPQNTIMRELHVKVW